MDYSYVLTSDEEATVSRRRKRRNRTKKSKVQTDVENTEANEVVNTEQNDDKQSGDHEENITVDYTKTEETEEEATRRTSARNHWLKLQLENNGESDEEKPNKQDEELNNTETESCQDEAGISDASENNEEPRTPENKYRMSAAAKSYWLSQDKRGKNENQENDVYLDAEDGGDGGGDEIIKVVASDENDDENSDENDKGENNDREGTGERDIQEPYRMSTSVKSFWLQLEKSEIQTKQDVNEADEIDDQNEDGNIEDDGTETIIAPDDDDQKSNRGNESEIEIKEVLEIEAEEQDIADENTEDNVDESKEGEQELERDIDQDNSVPNENENLDREDYAPTFKEKANIIQNLFTRSVARDGESPKQLIEDNLVEEGDQTEALTENEELVISHNEQYIEGNEVEELVLRRFVAQEATNTDDELNERDNFNSNYRYVVRHRRSDRFSKKSNEEPIYQNITEAQRSSMNEIDKENIDLLYKFEFPDAASVLNSMERNRVVVDAHVSTMPAYVRTNSKEEKIEDQEENSEITFKMPLVNTKALPKDSITYELEKFEKNALIIFNQENIDGYSKRLGSKCDVEALKYTFERYGFEVVEHCDLVRDRIFEELEEFSKRDFTDYGCVAVAVLTHGSSMGTLRAKDREFYETDIIKYLKTSENLTLVTKPKVIIIQACRGKEMSKAFGVYRMSSVRKDHVDATRPKTYTLPVEADFLVLHSTFVGKVSFRDELFGSWFIQTLCRKIFELSHIHDLESIFTEVKREVAIEKSQAIKNRATNELDIDKQMPVLVSTLIRKLYLRPFGETSPKIPETENPLSPIIQYSHCECFLDRFEYMKECIRHFLEDHEDDDTAKEFLSVADAIEDGVAFNAVKEKISRAMSNHLLKKAKDYDYFKYLFLLKPQGE